RLAHPGRCGPADARALRGPARPGRADGRSDQSDPRPRRPRSGAADDRDGRSFRSGRTEAGGMRDDGSMVDSELDAVAGVLAERAAAIRVELEGLTEAPDDF